MDLADISPTQLIIIGSLLTLLISDELDTGELNVIGNLVVAVGSFMLTVAAQKDFIKSSNEDAEAREEIRKQIDDLQKKYAALERRKHF